MPDVKETTITFHIGERTIAAVPWEHYENEGRRNVKKALK